MTLLKRIITIIFIGFIAWSFFASSNEDDKANEIVINEINPHIGSYNSYIENYINTIENYDFEAPNSSFKDFSVKLNSNFTSAKNEFDVIQAKLSEIKQLRLSENYKKYIDLYQKSVDRQRNVVNLIQEELNKLNPALYVLDELDKDLIQLENIDWYYGDYDEIRTTITMVKRDIETQLSRVNELRSQGIVTDEFVDIFKDWYSLFKNFDNLLDAIEMGRYETAEFYYTSLENALYSIILNTEYNFLIYMDETFSSLDEQIQKEMEASFDAYDKSKEYFDRYIYKE